MTVSPGSLVIASTVQLWRNASIMRRSVEKFHLVCESKTIGLHWGNGFFWCQWRSSSYRLQGDRVPGGLSLATAAHTELAWPWHPSLTALTTLCRKDPSSPTLRSPWEQIACLWIPSAWDLPCHFEAAQQIFFSSKSYLKIMVLSSFFQKRLAFSPGATIAPASISHSREQKVSSGVSQSEEVSSLHCKSVCCLWGAKNEGEESVCSRAPSSQS